MFRKDISLKYQKILTLLLVLTSISFLAINAVALNYTPSKPFGPEKGIVNEEYTYKIFSAETGSKWIFDWGDGTYSPWITFDNTSIYQIQRHGYNNPGIYQIRIKYKNNYGEESRWSQPLNVSIYATDKDDKINHSLNDDVDWWITLFKEFIETDDYDPEIHPIFVDDYTLDEIIELILGLDLKNPSDITTVEYENNTYFLIDTDNDEKIDKFYVLFQGETMKPLDYHEEEKLIESIDKLFLHEDIDKEETEPISSVFTFPLWAVFIPLIVIFLVFILFKTGVLYFYEEEIEE